VAAKGRKSGSFYVLLCLAKEAKLKKGGRWGPEFKSQYCQKTKGVRKTSSIPESLLRVAVTQHHRLCTL
jgi:hypothetical protein